MYKVGPYTVFIYPIVRVWGRWGKRERGKGGQSEEREKEKEGKREEKEREREPLPLFLAGCNFS